MILTLTLDRVIQHTVVHQSSTSIYIPNVLKSAKNFFSGRTIIRVNFGPLAAEIVSLVWGTPGNFNGFRVLAALLHGTLVVGVSQTAALNRGRHLYSAGRPSRWALAHISSYKWDGFYISFAFLQHAVTSCGQGHL